MSTEENPEEKYRGLINGGIIVSGLLIIGIFITIGITKAKIADRPEVDEDYYKMLQDSIMMADVLIDDYNDYDDPGTYYDGDPSTLESENDSLRREIRNNCSSCTYQDEMLDHLQKETDNCAKLIREIIADLEDTIANPGVSGPVVSMDYFARTNREEELFSKLFEYRTTTEDLADGAGIYDGTSYRDYLPLRETSTYGYVKTWDESEFEQDPVEVIAYLKHMEMDLRYYENKVLWDML